jgi:hypothetical protein
VVVLVCGYIPYKLKGEVMQTFTKQEAFKETAKALGTYDEDFEKLWSIYPSKKGSKNMAYYVYKKKWKSVNIHALLVVVDEWIKLKNETSVKLDFIPHLENFLHRDLENFISEKIES